MRLILSSVILALLSACSSPQSIRGIEDLPTLVRDTVAAPQEVVYLRLSSGLSKCFGNSETYRIYEDKRDRQVVLGIIGEGISGGYTAFLKVAVVPGENESSTLHISWVNPFWESRAARLPSWARGEEPVCD